MVSTHSEFHTWLLILIARAHRFRSTDVSLRFCETSEMCTDVYPALPFCSGAYINCGLGIFEDIVHGAVLQGTIMVISQRWAPSINWTQGVSN